MSNLADDLGESLSQDDKGRRGGFGQRLGNDGLSRFDVCKLDVAWFPRVTIGVPDRWRAPQDERVTGKGQRCAGDA